MSTKAKDTQGEGFEPVSAGTHQAVCIAVVDIGTQPSGNPAFPDRQKILLTWEIPDEKITITKGDASMECARVISATYTNTLASKGKLRPLLESWRGRPFTEAELEGFDLRDLLGANCLLSIVHNTKATKTYANVASISPLMKSMKKLVAENPHVHFDLDDFLASGDSDLPTTLHKWIQGKIMQSTEYLRSKDPHHSRTEPTEAEKANLGADDDSVPF